MNELKQPAPEFQTPVPNTDGGKASIGSENTFEILEYLRIIRRRWLLIALCTFLVVSLAAFFTLRIQKIYRATATVRIETQAPQVLGSNVENVVEMGTGSFWSNVEYYETQYRIIESRAVALKVVEEYNLHENAEFMNLPRNQLPADKILAASILKGMLTVEPVKDSRLAMIHIDHPDPEKAALYANAIARAYEKQNLSTMRYRTLEAVDWLSERLDKANTDLNNAEGALQKYKETNDILTISLEDRRNLISAQMTSVAQLLTEAKGKRIELQARRDAIAKVVGNKDPMAIPIEALNASQLIQNLKQDYAVLSQNHGELSARYGANHPSMVEIKAKMDRISADISREVNNVISAVNSELDAAKTTEAGLSRELEKHKAEAQALEAKSIPYNSLARNTKNYEQVYQLLQGRAEEAKLSRFLTVNNVEILDLAIVPEAPIKPRVMMNIAMAALIGLLLSIGLAILVEFSDRTIRNQDDIEAFGLSFLGIVPSIRTATGLNEAIANNRRDKKTADAGPINFDRYSHQYPKSQLAESLRSVRTNLLFMSADAKFQRLLVTSPLPQEGKTTVATNLAIIMAQSDSRVLLIDADMRRPRIHTSFGIKRPLKGLSTMILGESTAADSIITTEIPNLDVLVCGPTPPNPAELLHSDRFARVLEELAQMYDRIIIDSPPVGVVTDAAILSRMVNGTLLVVKNAHTTRDSAKYAYHQLSDIGARIYGAIINDLDLSNRKYGQYYHHYAERFGTYYSQTNAQDTEVRDSIPADKTS